MAPMRPEITPDRESIQADTQEGFYGPKTATTGKGGRKPLPDSERIQRSRIYLRGADWKYVRSFGVATDEPDTDKADTLAIEGLIETLKRYRPDGPKSGGGDTHAAKLRPGTRTMLKKELAEANERIAELEARLREAEKGNDNGKP